MQIETRRLSDIKPYPNNPRKNDNAVDGVAESIKQCGYCAPIIVDENGIILAGHTRLKALKKLGWKEAEVVVRDGLTEEQKKKYRLLDNKTGEIALWDTELLQAELVDINFDGYDFVFDMDTPGEVIEDEAPEVDEVNPPTAKLGDIWQLGRHRVMCGDSTDAGTVALLMDGQKADMVFTDPPYNIDYCGVKDKRKIENDKMGDDEFVDFLENSLMFCETVYVCCSWQYVHLFRKAMESAGMPAKAMIVWDKVNAAQHLDKYYKQHEIILYHGAFGGEKTIRGDVWQLKRQRNTLHPTMKPIELIAMALEDNAEKKVVYDGFGGSGSTLIACEQLDRTCYMMELDPKYVDVIVKRWEALTGQTAKLVKDE